jgi:hypothetical protein
LRCEGETRKLCAPKEEPPLSRGLSRFARHRSLGLIQQQFRHLASLRNDHSGGKLVKSYFFFFFGAFFFAGIALFNLDLDLAALFGAFFRTPGIDTSSSFWLLLEKHPFLLGSLQLPKMETTI